MTTTMTAVKDITLSELLDSYDWAEVFADESSGNTDKDTDECPPGADVDRTPPNRSDVGTGRRLRASRPGAAGVDL